MPKPNKPIDSSTSKVYDSSVGKIYAPNGSLAADGRAKRIELLEGLISLIQQSITQHLSGGVYSSKLDVFTNSLFENKTYCMSLKEACKTIREGYPSAAGDDALEEIETLCDAVLEGLSRIEEYISAIRPFADDLNKIQGMILTQAQHINAEIP